MRQRFNLNECDPMLDLDMRDDCNCQSASNNNTKIKENLKVPLDAVISQCDEYFAKEDFSSLGEHLRFWHNEAQSIKDLQGELSILNEMIGYYRLTNNKDEAIQACERALIIIDDLPYNQTTNIGTILLNAATAFSAFGNYNKALQLYNRTQEIYNSNLNTDQKLYAGLWNNMASTLERMNNPHGAEQSYFRAIEVLTRLNMLADLAVAYVNLAGLYFNTLKDNAKYVDALDKALDIFNSSIIIKDSYYAHTCRKCAQAFSDMGYKEIAEDLQKRADEIYESY